MKNTIILLLVLFLFAGAAVSFAQCDFDSIAGGDYHTIALKSDGTVWTFGWNYFGQLGDGTNTDSNSPVQVVGPGGVGFLDSIIAIAGGGEHTIALKSDSTVWTFGYNNYGQLSDGTNTDRHTPVGVECPDFHNAPPIFTLCPCPDDTAICRDSTLMVEILAEDEDGDTVSYSLIDAPEGASMDSTTLVYTPPSTGVFHIIITACDPFDACDTCDFYVAVDSCAINTPPSFTLCPDDTAICRDSTLMVEVLAEDDDGNEIYYSLINAPSGASITGSEFSFSPTDTGIFDITITACDDSSGCDTCEFYVVVDSCDTDAVLEKPIKPDAFFLDVNPNPFNSSVKITVGQTFLSVQNGQIGMSDLPVTIKIYDLRGHIVGANGVRPMDEGRIRDAPTNRTFVWTPGQTVPSGIYIARARLGTAAYTKLIVYLK